MNIFSDEEGNITAWHDSDLIQPWLLAEALWQRDQLADMVRRHSEVCYGPRWHYLADREGLGD